MSNSDLKRLGSASSGLDRQTMCSPAPSKVSVEDRCDAPGQELCATGYRKPAIIHHHDAIGDKAVEARTINDGLAWIPAVTTGCLGKIDCQIAHDSFDNLGVEAIVVSQ
jgi:hypothetical protein